MPTYSPTYFLTHSLADSLKGGCGIKVIFNALLKKYVKIEKINDKMLKLVCINVISDTAPATEEAADKAKPLPVTSHTLSYVLTN